MLTLVSDILHYTTDCCYYNYNQTVFIFVQQLRQELEEKFNTGTFNWSDVMPNDCAALLKQFLRELPTPLLTYDYLEAFPQVERESENEILFQCIRLSFSIEAQVFISTCDASFHWRSTELQILVSSFSLVTLIFMGS